MNYPALHKDIIDLESCEEQVRLNYQALKTAFENNHFSQIAMRQKHYRSYIESLEILNIQGQNCKEMVNQKLKHIRFMEHNLDKLKSKILEKVREDKKTMTMLLDTDLTAEQ